MDKLICFIYTKIIHFHKNEQIDLSNEKIFDGYEINKKNLYHFGQMIEFNYEIGYYKNKTFIITKKNNFDIKQNTNLITLENSLYEIMMQFKSDTYNIDIIIGYNIEFHLKNVLVELVRNNIYFDITKYVILDIKTFFHDYESNNLNKLYNLFFTKHSNVDNIEMIKLIFYKLYNNYKKSLE